MTIEYKDSKRIVKLSTDNFATTSLSLTGLKAYYKFDEASGNLINQSTTGDGLGSNADGTASGDPTYSATGKINKAISFDGDGDKFTLGTTAGQWNFLHNNNNFSVSFWLKLNATPSENQGILGTGTGGSSIGFDLTVNHSTGGKLRASIENGAGASANIQSSAGFVPQNTTTWYHYVLTFSNGSWNIYRNGGNNESASSSVSWSTSNHSRNMELANANANTASDVKDLTGELDEVSIWNRVLTSDEISALYSNGGGVAVDDAKSSFISKPTDVQDNSILVEKDTARRYWFDVGADSNVELTTGTSHTLNTAGWNAEIYASELADNPIIGDVITGVKYYISANSGNVRFGLYDDNGSGQPQNLLAETASTATSGTGWNEVNFSTSYTVTSTDTLHIAIQSDSSSLKLGYSDIPNARSKTGAYSYQTFPSSISSILNGEDQWAPDFRAVVERPAAPAWTRGNVPTPTYESNFTVDNWLDQNSTYIGVDTGNNRLDFAVKRDSTRASSVDMLGETISDTKWILRWDMVTTTLTQSASNANNCWFGISSLPSSTAGYSAKDWLGLWIDLRQTDSASNTYAETCTAQGNHVGTKSTAFTSKAWFADNYTFGLQLQRISADSFKISIFDSHDYDNEIESQTVTTSSSVNNLRYLGIWNANDSALANTYSGYTPRIRFWNNLNEGDLT